MAAFIKIGDNYNPITTQGEGNKIINIEYIIHVTDWSRMKYKVRKGVNSRIYLSTGEYLDSVEKYEDIIKSIEDSGIEISPKLKKV